MSNSQDDDIQNLKRKSTDGNYTALGEDGGPGYAERRTLRPVPRGSMNSADRKKIDNEERLILKRGLGAETSSKISDFLKRRGYKRDKSIKRETYKPDIKIIEENPELRNLNEQAKDKGKINLDRWRVRTRKLRQTNFDNPLYKKKGKMAKAKETLLSSEKKRKNWSQNQKNRFMQERLFKQRLKSKKAGKRKKRRKTRKKRRRRTKKKRKRRRKKRRRTRK